MSITAPTTWQRIIRELRDAGITYERIAIECQLRGINYSREGVAFLARGRQQEPAYSRGAVILELHRRHCPITSKSE